MAPPKPEVPPPPDQEPPPILGSWNRLYVLLIAIWVAQVLFYLWLTEWAS